MKNTKDVNSLAHIDGSKRPKIKTFGFFPFEEKDKEEAKNAQKNDEPLLLSLFQPEDL